MTRAAGKVKIKKPVKQPKKNAKSRPMPMPTKDSMTKPKEIKKMKNGGPVKKPTNRKIKVRGTGAATKGLFARGPMA
jgi:hypothetical protein